MKLQSSRLVSFISLFLVLGALVFGASAFFLQATPEEVSQEPQKTQPVTSQSPPVGEEKEPEQAAANTPATKPVVEKKRSSPDAQKFFKDLAAAPVLNSNEIIHRIKKCNIEVSVDEPLDDVMSENLFRSEAIRYLKSRGIEYDPKATAQLIVKVRGTYQKRTSGRYTIWVFMKLPALHFHGDKVWLSYNTVSFGNLIGNVVQTMWLKDVDEAKTQSHFRSVLKTCLDGNGWKPTKEQLAAADKHFLMHGAFGGKDWSYDFYRNNYPALLKQKSSAVSLGDFGWHNSEVSSVNVYWSGDFEANKEGIQKDMLAELEQLQIKQNPNAGQHFQCYIQNTEQWRFEQWIYAYACLWYLHYDHVFFCHDGEFMRSDGLQMLGNLFVERTGKHTYRKIFQPHHRSFAAEISRFGK